MHPLLHPLLTTKNHFITTLNQSFQAYKFLKFTNIYIFQILLLPYFMQQSFFSDLKQALLFIFLMFH